jgi:6-bladed beta-propeller
VKSDSRLATGVLLWGFLAAIGADRLSAQAPVVRDSAGIEIVENSSLLWSSAQTWRVADEPFLRIGSLDDPEYALYRITWTGRLSTGEIVALSAGNHRVIVFDEDGRKIREFGNRGEGPGEFMSPSNAVILPGDSILIKDQDRAKVFAADGTFAREFRVPGTPLPMNLAGLASNRLIYFGGDGGGRTATLTPEGRLSFSYRAGLDQGSYTWLAIDRDGVVRDTIAILKGREDFVFTDGPTLGTIPAWGRRQFSGVGRRHLVTGWNDTFELHQIRMDGQISRIIRLDEEPRQSNREEMMRRFTWFFQSSPVLERRARARFSEVPHHNTWPAFGEIKEDLEQNLWVASYSPVGFDDNPSWFVFDPQGFYLGKVSDRPRIRIDEIGTDYILGLERGEFDVEYVVMYRLVRPR